MPTLCNNTHGGSRETRSDQRTVHSVNRSSNSGHTAQPPLLSRATPHQIKHPGCTTGPGAPSNKHHQRMDKREGWGQGTERGRGREGRHNNEGRRQKDGLHLSRHQRIPSLSSHRALLTLHPRRLYNRGRPPSDVGLSVRTPRSFCVFCVDSSCRRRRLCPRPLPSPSPSPSPLSLLLPSLCQRSQSSLPSPSPVPSRTPS